MSVNSYYLVNGKFFKKSYNLWFYFLIDKNIFLYPNPKSF